MAPRDIDPPSLKGLHSARLPNEDFQDLLSEAARYSIHDVDALDFESSVASNSGRSIRLVEKARFQFDYDLWAILVRYRMLVYGNTGIKTIWNFLTRRDRVRLLPVDWPTEDSLWGIFIALGLQDHEFLGSVAKHARELWRQRQMRRESLYVEVVGGLLKGNNAAAAPKFSERMHPGFPISSEELLELFFQACSSAHPGALEIFCRICDTVPNHKLYGIVIPNLCREERGDEAMTMHSYFIRRHDYPSTFDAIEPLVRHIAQCGHDLSVFVRQLEEAGLSFGGRAQTLYDSVKVYDFGIPREDIDLATNRTFGVKRTKISDAFAARFFATKSFSFAFALNGLRVLGLDELGPLSLREIALHSGTASVFRQRLKILDSMEIDTGGSAYSRVVRKLVREQECSLLMDVVLCDQHPDVFEDQRVQLQLLANYHCSKDWRQVNRTLAILSSWGDSKKHSSNALLRGALFRRDWPEIQAILAQARRDGSQISQANIVLMRNLILRPRSAAQQVDLRTYGFADLKFLFTLWQSSLESGINIPVKAWGEPLRRLGMMGRWADLEKACLWLCCWYSPKDADSVPDNSAADVSVLPSEPIGRKGFHNTVISELFSPEFQRAIVEWGFISGFKGRKASQTIEDTHSDNNRVLREAPWVCGIKLLTTLRRLYGIQLHDVSIKIACQERLRQLFSQGGRSRLRHNREARSMNRATIHGHLGWINMVYGQILLDPCDARIISSFQAKQRLKPREAAKSLRSLSKRIRKRQRDTQSHGPMSEAAKTAHEDDIEAADREIRPRADQQLRKRTAGSQNQAYGKGRIASSQALLSENSSDENEIDNQMRRTNLDQSMPPSPEKDIAKPITPILAASLPHGVKKFRWTLLILEYQITDPETTTYASPLIVECLTPKCIEDFSAWAERVAGAFKVTEVAGGSYGEVFKLCKRETPSGTAARMPHRDPGVHGSCVFKLIPLRSKSNPSSNHTKLAALVHEIQILKRMNTIPGFVRYRDLSVLQGPYALSFREAHHDYKRRRPSSSSAPGLCPRKQLLAMVEMEDASKDLDSICTLSAYQVFDIFWMTCCALCFGEENAEFEHRDLRIGNVCVRSTTPDNDLDISPILNTTMQSDELRASNVSYSNLRITIIDYTPSPAPHPRQIPAPSRPPPPHLPSSTP